MVSAHYVDTRTGEEFEQPADLVVLTSFVFNNVRLMLLSEIGEPYNPATGQGVIGRNFTDHHTSAATIGLFDNKKFNTYANTGTLGSTMTDYTGELFDHTNLDFIHGGQIELRTNFARAIDVNMTPRGTPQWGREFKKQSLYYQNRYLMMTSQRATMPSKYNYLDLDPNYTDDLGDPLIRMTYDFTDNDRGIHEFTLGKHAEIFEEMGADHLLPGSMAEHFNGVISFQHNGGGAIMGNDPETSAVNTYLQSWDIDNLFVCGSSAFPHFGVSNPTTTAGALTYRATEGMIKYLKNGGQLVEAKKQTQKA